MSEIQRVALHSAPRSRKEKEPPARSVRLNVELGASNEDQYPEISYRDLIVAHLRKKRNTENGKKPGLDPFSDNEDDVARIAKQFENKYGSNSTYGRTGKAKRDEFADIGAGYDENDSFIDNTDGYDEMCPPGYDTFHGGFYINSGSLEFKNVQDDRAEPSDGEIGAGQRSNKRRISSSSSEESSSESSSESESGAEADKAKERVLNGEHKTDRRKKKKVENKKKKAKKMRTEASAATSGKHTSDDAHHDGESVDSRTSHTEDSLTSKPAPSSENAVTSDSSRDVAEIVKPDVKLPPLVNTVLAEMNACVLRLKDDNTSLTPESMEPHTDLYVLRLEQALGACSAEVRCRRAAWAAAARILSSPRTRLLHRARDLAKRAVRPAATPTTAAVATNPRVTEPKAKESRPAPVETSTVVAPTSTANPAQLSPEEKERQLNSILERLKVMIENQKPDMIHTYKTECERVLEENKKIALANKSCEGGVRLQERRLPKRRYPWCTRTRHLLAALVKLCAGGAGAGARGEEAAARVLATRVLPLFPPGFVRLPTLLRQADLNKDLKMTEIKKQKIPTPGHIVLNEPILPMQPHPVNNVIPKKPAEKTHEVACGTTDNIKLNGKQFKSQAQQQTENPSSSSQKTTFNSIFNSFTLSPSTEVFLEKPKPKPEEQKGRDTVTVEKVNEPVKINQEKLSKPMDTEKYVPPNSIGSITITPVTQPQKLDPRHQASKLANNTVTVLAKGPATESVIRVKSPAEIMKAATVINTDDKKKPDPKPPSVKGPITESVIRVKSPAELMKMASVITKEDKKKPDPKLPNPLHIKPQEKQSHLPLTVDTSYPKKPEVKTHSPTFARQANGDNKQNENLKSELNLPRPGLIPIHHSPTFAKPADKKVEPPKQKDHVEIVNDIDPLSDVLQVDDSSSDVELVEESSSKADPLSVPENIKINSETKKTEVPRIQEPQESFNQQYSKDPKIEDRSSKTESSVEKKDEPNALSRLKDDYSHSNHKHRSHKREHSDGRSDRKEEQHNRNEHQPEKILKREDGPSDKNQERSYKHDSDRRADYSHGDRREKDRRDGYSSPQKSYRSDDRSHQRPDRKDYETDKRERSSDRSDRDKHDRERMDRERERQNRERLSAKERDRQWEKDVNKQSNCSFESVVHQRKAEERAMSEQNSTSRRPPLQKATELDDAAMDIESVMRGLRDLQNSQEQHFSSNSYGSPANEPARSTSKADVHSDGTG